MPRRLSRRLHQPHGVTALACTGRTIPGGRNAPPRPPAPLRGVVRAQRRRRQAMPATGTTAAPLAPARRAPGVAPHPWHPERAWLEAPSGRAARRFSARATPLGGRRAPGRCAGAGVASAPGPGCGRSPHPPLSAPGGLCRGVRLARRAVPLRACTTVTARLAGRSVVRFLHPGRCPGPRPRPIAGGAPLPQARGDTGPPLDPPTERLRRAEACTPARPRAVPLRAAACRGRGAACRAPLAPRPAACLAGRPVVRFWHPGQCPGPRGRCGSAASTPLASLRAAARPAAPGV